MSHLIFGYASLMYPGGINGRGMRKQYKETDLFLATLRHHRRELNAAYMGDVYFGLVPDENSEVTGCVFEVSDSDWNAFYRSEGSDNVYTFPNVRDLVEFDERFIDRIPAHWWGAAISTCMTKSPESSVTSPIEGRYVLRCVQGIIDTWGKDEALAFLMTSYDRHKSTKVIKAKGVTV